MGTFILEMDTQSDAFLRDDGPSDLEALKATLHSAIEQIVQPGIPHPARLEIRIRDERGKQHRGLDEP